MQSHIRTFVAIKIYPDKKLLDQIHSLKRVFEGEQINWVNEGNFHLTLRFLGNTTREQLYALVDRFEKLAGEHYSFQLKISGAGYFKSKGRPRVLYARINDSEPLQNLVDSIEENVTAVGFHKELKPFRPHLTIGRIKNLENNNLFFSYIDGMEKTELQKLNVRGFILYRSILSAEGPIYKSIKNFELK